MAYADLFLGVVSHIGSRFARNQGAEGFPARLVRTLEELGTSVAYEIELRDLFTESGGSLTPSSVQESLSAQLEIDCEWTRYVSGGDSLTFRQWLRFRMLIAARQWRRLKAPPTSSIERLLNIEFAHISLLRHGIESDAPWIVIIEDDGDCTDVTDCAAGLLGLFSSAADEVAFINLSESFDLETLDVRSVLHTSGVPWQGSTERNVLSADRPVTNTVCAVAYRRNFAEHLLAEFEAQGPFPVVPIDWKLNQAVMSMHGRGDLGAGSCWWVHPAPVRQLSMRMANDVSAPS